MSRRLALAVIIAAGIAAPGAAQAQVPCVPDSHCATWAVRHNGSAALYDRGADVAYAPGLVVVAGSSTSTAGGPDVITVAHDAASGAERWVATYDGPEHLSDFGTAAVVGDGVVLVAGRSEVSPGRNGYVTLAYRLADGAALWSQRFATAEDSEATALALSPDGARVYVTGFSATGVSPTAQVVDYDLTTVAYSVASGQQLWAASYQGPAQFWDIGYAVGVAQTAAGERVVVTGRSNGASTSNNDTDFVTIAYTPAGAQSWLQRYDGGSRDVGYDLAVAPDGESVYVTGESVGASTDSDYGTVAYDAATGQQRWVARYAEPAMDLALGVAVSPAGDRVAVTGFSLNPVAGFSTAPVRDAATLLYDAGTGAQVWAARHAEPDGAAATAVAFTPDGSTVVAAGLENGNVVGVGVAPVGGQVGHAPALTTAYAAATGAELWSAHYSGPTGDEGASALAIAPDGAHVFVTGGGQGQDADVSTIAYPLTVTQQPVVPETPWVGLLLVIAVATMAPAVRNRWRRGDSNP